MAPRLCQVEIVIELLQYVNILVLFVNVPLIHDLNTYYNYN